MKKPRYVCVSRAHRGWVVGERVGELPLDRCLARECPNLCKEEEKP